MKRLKKCLVVAPLLVLPITHIAAQQRGYVERSNGFDLNDNGILGEFGVDDLICDDTSGGTAPMPEDLDGDGDFEEQWYIDCDGGSNSGNCGSPGNPCRTIAFASNRADGSGDGNEDVFCFTGTCSVDDLNPGGAGIPGWYSVGASGSEVRSFRYPSNPTILAGWDRDGDNSYPPADTNDVSILDGSGGANRALSPGGSYREFAHFRAQNFNLPPGESNGGFAGAGNDDTTYWYFHDIELSDINRDQCTSSGRITFDLFAIGAVHLAVENIQAHDIGAYFLRGAGGNGPAVGGPMRFQNIDLTHHSCDGDDEDATVAKIWGYYSEVEFLDSYLDCNIDGWEGACLGLRPSQCTQDWVIRNNYFRNYANVMGVQASASGFCDGSAARPVDDIVFDRNEAVTLEALPFAPTFVSLSAGNSPSDPDESFEDVTITNNFFWAGDGYQNCLWYLGGNQSGAQDGRVIFANNTCHGYMNRNGWAAIMVSDENNFVHQNFLIVNNVISGMQNSSELNVSFGYSPSQWSMDENTYSPAGRYFLLPGPTGSLSSWRNDTGVDQSSNECVPQYVNVAGGDLHITSDDTCARDQGMFTGEPTLSFDIDGEPRPQQSIDRGADEVIGIFADGFEGGTTFEWQ